MAVKKRRPSREQLFARHISSAEAAIAAGGSQTYSTSMRSALRIDFDRGLSAARRHLAQPSEGPVSFGIAAFVLNRVPKVAETDPAEAREMLQEVLQHAPVGGRNPTFGQRAVKMAKELKLGGT